MTGRILGLDPGERRIGISVSDVSCTIATPVEFIDRRDSDYKQRIKSLCVEWHVTEIVVGLAISLDGTEGPAAALSRELGESVREFTGLPVEYKDERFTTVTADQALLQGGVKRKKRRDLRDQVAAAVMLQGYLDMRRYDSGNGTEPEDSES